MSQRLGEEAEEDKRLPRSFQKQQEKVAREQGRRDAEPRRAQEETKHQAEIEQKRQKSDIEMPPRG